MCNGVVRTSAGHVVAHLRSVFLSDDNWVSVLASNQILSHLSLSTSLANHSNLIWLRIVHLHDHALAHRNAHCIIKVHASVLLIYLLVKHLVILIALEVWRILLVIVDHLMLKLVIGWSHEPLERVDVAFVQFVVPVYVLAILIVLQRIVVLLFLSIDDLLIEFVNLVTDDMAASRCFFDVLLVKTVREVLILLGHFVFIIVINRSNVLLNVGLMSFIIFVFRDRVSQLFVIFLFCVINIFKVFIIIGVLLELINKFFLIFIHSFWSIEWSKVWWTFPYFLALLFIRINWRWMIWSCIHWWTLVSTIHVIVWIIRISIWPSIMMRWWIRIIRWSILSCSTVILVWIRRTSWITSLLWVPSILVIILLILVMHISGLLKV